MSTYRRLPPCRSLDIYRLVIARRLKQLDVAGSFHVHPSRISQVIRRVRNWVNHTLGEWLFPGRDDLRFYAALEFVQIRVAELQGDPHQVTFAGPGWTYTRHTQTTTASLTAESSQGPQIPLQPPPIDDPRRDLTLSDQPIKSSSVVAADHGSASPGPAPDSVTPDIQDMGLRIAQLLILWKKHQKVSAAIKPTRF